MFEDRGKLREMVDSLYEATELLRRGDIIGHEAISGILGLAPHEGLWQHCIIRLNRRMEAERGISIWSVHGVGYALCTPQEQLDIARRRQLRARRQLRKGIRSIESIPATELSMRERESQQVQSRNLRAAYTDLTHDLRARLPTHRATATLPNVRPVSPGNAVT